jgi:hypothetical protein
MGQYYKPACINEFGNPVKGWVCSHDYHSGLKLMEHSWMLNPFVSAVEGLLVEGGDWYKKLIVWAGDYAEPESNTDKNIYSLCSDKTKVIPKMIEPLTYRYILNHTKNQFVDKMNVPDNDGWRIHPLPLLTCEGNGRGGGDYRGESDLVGSWSRNKISVSNEVPEGFTELKFDLVE